MTVETTHNSQEFEGNGSTTVFPFNFPYFNDDEILVSIFDDTGEETQLIQDLDYRLTSVNKRNGGQISYPITGDELPSSYTLLVTRELPITQTASIRNQGSFNASVHETVFDKVIMILQQFISRALNRFGGNNKMLQDIDMNGNRIVNLPAPGGNSEPLRKGDIVADATGATVQYVDDKFSVTTKDSPNVQHAINRADVVSGQQVVIGGRYSKGDGGNAIAFYVDTNTVSPNGLDIITLNNIPLLSLKIIVDSSTDARALGAKFDGVTDDLLPIQRLLDLQDKVTLSNGTFITSAALKYDRNGQTIIFDGCTHKAADGFTSGAMWENKDPNALLEDIVFKEPRLNGNRTDGDMANTIIGINLNSVRDASVITPLIYACYQGILLDGNAVGASPIFNLPSVGNNNNRIFTPRIYRCFEGVRFATGTDQGIIEPDIGWHESAGVVMVAGSSFIKGGVVWGGGYDSGGRGGIVIAGDSCSVTGCNIEGWNTRGIELNSPTIQSCDISTNRFFFIGGVGNDTIAGECIQAISTTNLYDLKVRNNTVVSRISGTAIGAIEYALDIGAVTNIERLDVGDNTFRYLKAGPALSVGGNPSKTDQLRRIVRIAESELKKPENRIDATYKGEGVKGSITAATAITTTISNAIIDAPMPLLSSITDSNNEYSLSTIAGYMSAGEFNNFEAGYYKVTANLTYVSDGDVGGFVELEVAHRPNGSGAGTQTRVALLGSMRVRQAGTFTLSGEVTLFLGHNAQEGDFISIRHRKTANTANLNLSGNATENFIKIEPVTR